MTNESYSKQLGWALAIWFAATMAVSAMGLLNGKPNQPPLALLLTVLVPLTAFGIWYARSAGLRQYLHSLDPRMLTVVQAFRVEGVLFLVLAKYRILPAAFALPAGWGDMTIGLTAAFVAFRLAKPKHRNLFVTWQVLGMVDLLVAVGLGTSSFLLKSDISTAPMAVLPLSAIPAFVVPLCFMLHLLCIAQARRWKTSEPFHSATRTYPSPA